MKRLYWTCRCGAENHAPADQSPDNVVVCPECDATWTWAQVIRGLSKRSTPERP